MQDFGHFLEGRAELALSKVSKKIHGKGSHVFHVGPQESERLRYISYIPTDTFKRTAPSYFWQLYPFNRYTRRTVEEDDTRYLDVALEVKESNAGKVTVTCYPVMPWASKDIDDLSDWASSTFAKKPSGVSADHRRRCNKAIEDGARAFKDFNTRVTTGRTLPLETALLRSREIKHPKTHRLRSLQDFVASSLQKEMESIALSLQEEMESQEADQEDEPHAGRGKGRVLQPRVSGLSGLTEYSRAGIDRTGIFDSHDLRQGVVHNASDVLQIIDESLKLSDEAAKKERWRMEREQIRHDEEIESAQRALLRQRGAPPSYDGSSSIGGPSALRDNVTMVSGVSAVSGTSGKKSTAKFPPSQQGGGDEEYRHTTQASLGPATSTEDPPSSQFPTAPLPTRPRSRRRGLWCFGRAETETEE